METRNLTNGVLGGKIYQMDEHYETENYVYEVEMQNNLNANRYDLHRLFNYGNRLQTY